MSNPKPLAACPDCGHDWDRHTGSCHYIGDCSGRECGCQRKPLAAPLSQQRGYEQLNATCCIHGVLPSHCEICFPAKVAAPLPEPICEGDVMCEHKRCWDASRARVRENINKSRQEYLAARNLPPLPEPTLVCNKCGRTVSTGGSIRAGNGCNISTFDGHHCAGIFEVSPLPEIASEPKFCECGHHYSLHPNGSGCTHHLSGYEACECLQYKPDDRDWTTPSPVPLGEPAQTFEGNWQGEHIYPCQGGPCLPMDSPQIECIECHAKFTWKGPIPDASFAALATKAVPIPDEDDGLFRIQDGRIYCRQCNCSNPLKFGSTHYTDCPLFCQPLEPMKAVPIGEGEFDPENVERTWVRYSEGFDTGASAGESCVRASDFDKLLLKLREALSRLRSQERPEDAYERGKKDGFDAGCEWRDD